MAYAEVIQDTGFTLAIEHEVITDALAHTQGPDEDVSQIAEAVKNARKRGPPSRMADVGGLSLNTRGKQQLFKSLGILTVICVLRFTWDEGTRENSALSFAFGIQI